uniref:Uncharacterized protein n=1 Tax=Arundo donax TaxID=35708 RepID=A0A0A9GP74_ARUDO
MWVGDPRINISTLVSIAAYCVTWLVGWSVPACAICFLVSHCQYDVQTPIKLITSRLPCTNQKGLLGRIAGHHCISDSDFNFWVIGSSIEP